MSFSLHLKFFFRLKECFQGLGGYLYFANGSKWWYGRFLTIQNVANLILIDHWVLTTRNLVNTLISLNQLSKSYYELKWKTDPKKSV